MTNPELVSTMSLFYIPPSPLYGRRPPSLLHSLLDDHDQIEQSLRPLRRSASRRRQESGCSEKVVDDDSRLKISLNVNHFKPEELKVDLDGRILRAEGKQEIKEENGYSLRTFAREWALPDNVDVEKIKSSLTEDGQLSIEAPKKSNPFKTSRSIPIVKSVAKKSEKTVAKKLEKTAKK